MSDLTSEERELVEQLADFVKLFVHKGEDGDDPPEEWAWTIRGSFPTEVMIWIRSHTNALVAGAYGVCANYLAPHTIHFDNPQIDVREAVQNEIRSLTPADAAQELERRLREAERKGRLESESIFKWLLGEEGEFRARPDGAGALGMKPKSFAKLSESWANRDFDAAVCKIELDALIAEWTAHLNGMRERELNRFILDEEGCERVCIERDILGVKE